MNKCIKSSLGPSPLQKCEGTVYADNQPVLIYHITKKPHEKSTFEVARAKIQCLVNNNEPIAVLFRILRA